MQIRLAAIPLILLSAVVISAACTTGGSPPIAPAGTAQSPAAQPAGSVMAPAAAGTFSLTVDSLAPGDVLPDLYTCRGTGLSPPVSWKGTPPETKSLVLIIEDPDAPKGVFTHWLVYNIPPRDGTIAGGQTNGKTLDDGAQQGEGSSGSRGYYPACPPVGSTHRYIFRLYASDQYFPLPTADRAAIDNALAGHTLAKTEYVTRFTR